MKIARIVPALLLAIIPAASQGAVPVTTAPLSQLLSTPQLSAPATVVARNQPTIASEISARIEAVPVHVGAPIEKGDPVARLDCRTQESQLRGAEATANDLAARREFAASQLKRARDLQMKKGISDEIVEQRAADLASLENQLAAQQELINQAALDVERCIIKAPFAAVVTERLADEGSLAAPGTPLVTLVQLDQLEVSADLRAGEARQVTASESTRLTVDGETYPLQLRYLVPVVDERTRTREARFIFVDAAAPPGATGRLVWEPDHKVLAAEYLVRREGALGFLYLNGNKAHFHPLADAVEGQPAIVTDLPPDTAVIVEGRQRLSDGDTVRVED